MLVDVMLVKQSSAEVYDLDVSDDATENDIENAARERLQETDWKEDHHGLLKNRVVEASNTPSSHEGLFYRRPPWISAMTAATRHHGFGNATDTGFPSASAVRRKRFTIGGGQSLRMGAVRRLRHDADDPLVYDDARPWHGETCWGNRPFWH